MDVRLCHLAAANPAENIPYKWSQEPTSHSFEEMLLNVTLDHTIIILLIFFEEVESDGAYL